MLAVSTPQPLKDIVYAVQSYLYWSQLYAEDGLWESMKNAKDFKERMSSLLPQCLDLIKQDS